VNSPDHPESTALGLVAQQYRRLGIRHKTLRDGEVLIIDGTTQFVCS
jgi:dipeptidase E